LLRPWGASAGFITPPEKGVEDMLRSVGSMEVRASRSTSKVSRLASNPRAVILIGLAVALSYGTALLAVLYAYRKGYGIVGTPELRALRFTAKGLG
jgi:hypothetical protein